MIEGGRIYYRSIKEKALFQRIATVDYQLIEPRDKYLTLNNRNNGCKIAYFHLFDQLSVKKRFGRALMNECLVQFQLTPTITSRRMIPPSLR